MGKSTSKVIEMLVLPYQPVRYVVTNTEKVILVTHDKRFAENIAESIKNIDEPGNHYITIR